MRFKDLPWWFYDSGFDRDGAGVLWVGYDRWPHAMENKLKPNADVPTKKGISLGEIQISGLLCDHKQMFGLMFALPPEDPLCGLARSYFGTSVYMPTLDEVLRLRDRLERIGLEIHPTLFSQLSEAYLPISQESAWNYAKRHRLKLLEDPNSKRWVSPTRLGLSSWKAARRILTGEWVRLEKRFGSKFAIEPFHGVAAAIVENSD